nr:SH3 domain-containing protein [Clostridia bacterium]
RKVLAMLLAVGMLLTMLPAAALADEELFFSPKDPVQQKGEEDKSDFDHFKDLSASIMETLGHKDWDALAEKVKLTGDWRHDLVNLAQSQIGYQQEKDGMTLYTRWAGEEEAVEDWSAYFINWVADKMGLKEKVFPQGWSYKSLRSKMDGLKALKKVSRSSYPASGDLALIEANGQKLVGIVVYISNDYASVIHGDDNGRVTKENYKVGGREFKSYVDLTVLMELAGIEVGKGGTVPVIPGEGIAAWTNTNAVYMRAEPTTASKRVATVKKPRTALLVISAEMQEDGYIWYGVKYKQYEGYIRGDLLELDLAAIPAVTPVPEKTPEPTPVSGCVTCARSSMGLALPVDCCYEHLASMSLEEAAAFMRALRKDDQATFVLYVSCAMSHAKEGGRELLCLGKECGLAAWSRPSVLHDENCPWHKNGLAAQERVVNLTIREARKGQEVMISYEIYGASTYQWHEVKSVINGDGTVTETDTILEGERAASILVKAKDEPGVTYSYYCVASIVANGNLIEIASKETALSVESAPIVARAILGEEINFTYENNRASAYQWYVQTDDMAAPAAISAEDPAYTGAQASTLTFRATLENNGARYTCEAIGRNGNVISASGQYSYAIHIYQEAPDTTVCEGHDLCRYIEELAAMTMEERYTALTETWYISAASIAGEADPQDCLAEYIMFHWYFCHADVYPNLLCTCAPTDEDRLLRHPYDEIHEAECPWYIAPVENDEGETVIVPRADQAEFDLWAATATEEMIARAMTVPTLDHTVIEYNDDNTCAVYIARYPEPVGSIDANGYLTYGSPALVIAWVDFSTGTVYALNNLPSDAPVRAN